MESVRAATVAMMSSGQMIVVMMDAGTTLIRVSFVKQVLGQPASLSPETGLEDHLHSANSEASDDQNAPELVQVVDVRDGECPTAGGHEDGGDDEEFAVVASEDAEKPENNAGACKDGEADGNTSNTHLDWVVAVDVEGLSRPEHDDRKEIGS